MAGVRSSLLARVLAVGLFVSAVGRAEAAAPAPRPDAALGPEVAIARATAYYEAGEYVRCADAFGALLDDPSQVTAIAPRLREQARVYRAACLVGRGKVDAADEEFRRAVLENPQMAVPNAIVFPPAVIERFVVVRSALTEEIRRADEERAELERELALAARRRAEAERRRIAMLERLVAEETIVVKSRRWMAWVPFGVGQFQNRDYLLGSVFLASETVLLATALTAVSIELSLNSQANGGKGLTDKDELATEALNQNLRTANQVALVSTGSLLGVVALGIVEANLSFVPEWNDGVRRRKPRDVRTGAPSVRLAPAVAIGSAEARVGVLGRF